jgi:hypothetical protein
MMVGLSAIQWALFVSKESLLQKDLKPGISLVLPILIVQDVRISNWFLMVPSIATKFQYVNSPFIFLLTTCFGPYGPSSGEIYS